jgi:hypothetical protein
VVVAVAPGDRIRTGLVTRKGLPLDDLGQVGTDVRRVAGARRFGRYFGDDTILDEDELVIGSHRIPRLDRHLPNGPGGRRRHLVLHFHRLHDDDRTALPDVVAGLHQHLDDGAGERRYRRFHTRAGKDTPTPPLVDPP